MLLYSEASREILLVEQFRYPAFAGIRRNGLNESGWLLEIVAGIKDDEGPEVARREIFEETGLSLIRPLEYLITFYVSPGGSSDRI